ncbi:uncharacterized protein LOC120420378 [Culex pipiens pallens]|uniref:uncharacterized protein LOC120420378 n=1 Tax=Culex pipiens pallens TaxID=42434 RepID=UPI001954330A|nr:uncharacterized protein LOC120420378 [Culex pipiens pallens]
MNSFKRAKTTESGDMIYTEYKGKKYAVPRSEYKKPLPTIPGQPSLATTSSNLTGDSQPISSTSSANPIPTTDSFSLDALTESRQTLQPGPTSSSTRTITSSKGEPPAAIADSLLQLKSSVVDLIDKTISDIETKQQQQQQEKEQPAAAAFLHPGGDSNGAKVALHRMQNLQVLKTESFAQSKRDVRKKLYREIETILVRLKDMDFLE